jgi:hypothetical protein
VLPVGLLIAIVVVAVVLTMWATFTLTRLDRLHARVDAAQAAFDAQLVRRAAALQHLARTAADSDASGAGAVIAPELRARAETVAHAALAPVQDADTRQAVENAVGRAVTELAQAPGLDPASLAELREAAARVMIARRFYNDAVRDTRALRSGRLPRALHLAGRRAMPEFFDIDDTPPARAAEAESPTTEEDRP